MLTKKQLVEDIQHCASFHHTGILENYHNVRLKEETSLGSLYASYQEQLTTLLAPTSHVITTVRDDTSPGTLDLLDVPYWATVYSFDI